MDVIDIKKCIEAKPFRQAVDIIQYDPITRQSVVVDTVQSDSPEWMLNWILENKAFDHEKYSYSFKFRKKV
jgi:hypothetical protein